MPMPILYLLADETSVAETAAAVSNPWAAVILIVSVLVAAIVLVSYLTRAGMIARGTTKEAIRQPLFALLIVLSILLLVVNTFLPNFTLGEDFKMFIDCGLASLLISGLLMAVWTASTSVAAEIEGKTAMTLLSKPITRRQFVVGKYLGILNAVWIMLIPMIAAFLLLLYYKIGYDFRESSKSAPEHAERMYWVIRSLPGLLLIAMEIAVITAVSVAISTRVPMVVNIVSCFTIFVIGHLTAILVQSSVTRNEFVYFVANVMATILPQLDNFNITAAIATGKLVPPEYLGWSFLYCVASSLAWVMLAFILFEDRDLA